MDAYTALLLATAPVMLVVALSVRFAGEARIITSVDYSGIADVPGLHRWAGNRLLLLPVAAAAGGSGALLYPEWAALPLGASLAALPGVAAWIAFGARRFRSPDRSGRDA